MNMHQRSIPLFQTSKRPTIFSLLFLSVLISLTASCAQKTWDTNRYIHALERSERDQHQQPEKVIEALNLTPGMMVIDLGAGSGYFTRRLAESVGDKGRVIAIGSRAPAGLTRTI